MKKFTKISLIIVAVLGCVGMLLCGIASAMGAGYHTIQQAAREAGFNYGRWHVNGQGIYYGDDEEDWDIDVDTDIDVETGLENQTDVDTGVKVASEGVSYEYAVENIKNLDMDISASEVTFTQSEQTDAIVVTLYNCKEKYYEGKVEGDTLELKYDTEHHIHNTGKTMKMVVAIPAGMSFEKMNMDIGATNAEFQLKDVSCAKLLLNVGAGNVVAESFYVTELMSISAGVGNVEIDGGTYRNVELECGMGNFTMQGVLEGNLTAECGMGNMDLELQGDANAYNYDLSCGMGELSVNGTKYSSIAGSHKVKNEGAVGTINLECGMGSLELEIE